jgi:hypothetical protein
MLHACMSIMPQAFSGSIENYTMRMALQEAPLFAKIMGPLT